MNFQILSSQRAINVKDGSASQKMWVGILGMVNFGLFFTATKYLPLMPAFFATIFVSALLTFIFGRGIFKLYWRIINLCHNPVIDLDPWDQFSDFDKNADVLIFIFDFDDKLIQQGRFISVNNSRSDNKGVFLEPFVWDDKTSDSIYDYVNSGTLTRSYIDIERKLKYFAVILSA